MSGLPFTMTKAAIASLGKTNTDKIEAVFIKLIGDARFRNEASTPEVKG